MKQVTFVFQEDEDTYPPTTTKADRKPRLIELMAQAITAVLQLDQGEQDEPS